MTRSGEGDNTQTPKIMVVGDSISSGADRPSYRMPLYNRLADAECRVDMVGDETLTSRVVSDRNSVGVDFAAPKLDSFPEDNPEYPESSTWSSLDGDDTDHQSFGGIRTNQFLTGFPLNGQQAIRTIGEAVELHVPDYILVHLGTNDIAQDIVFLNSNSIGGWARQIADDMASLVNDALASHPDPDSVQILVANLIPREGETDVELVVLEEMMNAQLRIAFEARIANLDLPNVRIVDVANGFDNDSMTFDGIHPNRDGEIHLAERFMSALQDTGICGLDPEENQSTGQPASNRPAIVSPAPDNQLAASTVELEWTANGFPAIERWWVRAGSDVPGNASTQEYFSSGNIYDPEINSITVTDLPTDGSPVYISLHYLVFGNWLSQVFEYTAADD